MYTPAQLRDRLASVPAPSLVGIGDNVLDCYLHEDLAYPGGNALNVAVYSRLFFGADAGFVGILGDDRFATHLMSVLDELHVDYQCVRRAHGPNGMAFVSLDDDGDRRFVGSNYGGVQRGLRLRLTEQDFAHLESYDRVHTSVYSAIEPELPAFAERGIRVSFDFSDDAPAGLLARIGAHIDVGFFSGGALTESQIDDLAQAALEGGMSVAVVTRGSRGASAYTDGARAVATVAPVGAVDALGAGDAFISGFLAARAAGDDIDGCLEIAATAGALACTYRGAFGYPVEAGDDARAQLVRRYESV